MLGICERPERVVSALGGGFSKKGLSIGAGRGGVAAIWFALGELIAMTIAPQFYSANLPM
jgi:hypothetical protein